MRPHLRVVAEHPALNIIDVVATCSQCKTEQKFDLPLDAWDRWERGGLIQYCFPYLQPDARELLISGLCGVCFDKLFAEDDNG